MIRGCRFGLMTLLLCGAAPVLAGETPLYEAPAGWIEPVTLTEEQIANSPTVLMVDSQKRLDGKRVWDYRDIAFRIDSPDALNSAGTLSAAWIPDKGDLIINRVEILRDGQAIDVLDAGARFTVLRREEQLEQRSINGQLTATLAVPGLRVGDVLRLAYTTVQSDQALGDKVQSVDGLPVQPLSIGYARVKVSWPEGQPIKWLAGPGVEAPKPFVKDGFETIELALPLAERAELPEDAPLRFRRAPILQVGSFSSWQDVSQTLAPHFATEGSIAPGGEIAAKVSAIVKQTDDPLTRAAMALRIVQDEISYLANGLDGGNYLPQKPEDTWNLRYGDCKAKSVLLLAMLREMRISADAVVVQSVGGDAGALLLPMPADFDHMIVHARIGGEDYWLDGTASGSRLSNIGEVPPFGYALPLTIAGSELVPLVQRAMSQPDRTMSLVLDQSAGIDMPSLYTARMELNGALGAAVRAWISQPSETYRETFVETLMAKQVGDGDLLGYSMNYDDETAKATITARGLVNPQWTFERGVGRQYLPGLPATDFSFNPDRARQAWRDIPVQVSGPYIFSTELKVLLPEGGKGYELRGREIVNSEIAGSTISREAVIDGATLTVKEQLAATLAEIDPATIGTEKAKAARFGAGKLSLRAPEGAKREWDYASAAERKSLVPIEAAYAELIKKHPDRSAAYLKRAGFRSGVLDWTGALADIDAAIAIEPTAAAWFSRSTLLDQLGREEESLKAVRMAFELEPTPTNALAEAQAIADLGNVDEALQLVEDYEDDFEDGRAAVIVKAQLLGVAGRAGEGLALLDRLLVERPGDPDILNNICWHMGVWQVGEDQMLPQCTRAVESGGWAPPVLDSRAMAYFRLGKMEEALADLNAALTSAPELAPTLYMRGIIRTKIGDAEGRKDIERALRMNPSIKATYARFGIEVPAG